MHVQNINRLFGVATIALSAAAIVFTLQVPAFAGADASRVESDGTRIVFVGGPPPTLECRPFEMCSITLPRGEVLLSKHLGDAASWDIPDTAYGKDAEVTVVMVKPMTDKDGAWTTLAITTNGEPRGLYRIRLVVKKNAPFPSDIEFRIRATPAPRPIMPATVRAGVADHSQLLNRADDYRRSRAIAAGLATATPTIEPTAAPTPPPPPPGPCAERRDTAYNAPNGRAAFRPIDTYNDGRYTCVVLPAGVSRPVLYAVVGKDTIEQINWTFDGDRHLFVVQGLPAKLKLIDGDASVLVSHR